MEYTVTSISDNAFQNYDITSVSIPEGVESIGVEAFNSCLYLTSVSIPNTVTTIGQDAFGVCTGLTNITVASDNSNYSSINGALYNKTGTILIQCPGGLTTISISSTATSIGAKAFCYSLLASISIPSGVTEIGASAFEGCYSLAMVTFEGTAPPSFGDSSFGTSSNTLAPDAEAFVPFGRKNVVGGYINTAYPFKGNAEGTLILEESPDLGPSTSSSAPRALTPDEWVTQNLNIDQLVNHYGANPTGFLGMLYDNSMQRIPDSSGLNYWNEQLTGGVFGANQVVEHFLFSDEIGAKVAAMSSEEYVNFLYSTLFARIPDTDGYNNWLNYINSGFSKEETLRAFLNNEEWINICKLFNVTP